MNSIFFLGDAHLRDREPSLDCFLAFLKSIPGSAQALYLLGDLFDLWIGAPAFTSSAQRKVVEALERLRAGGLYLGYVEGNRDYHLRDAYPDRPFHRLAEVGLDIEFGNRNIHMAHGDLINRRDWQYRSWRGLAKSRWFWMFFKSLPGGLMSRLAGSLENQMVGTNLRHRMRFPEEECRAFATLRMEYGTDTLVLGHFHQEMKMKVEGPKGQVDIFVLPCWKETNRFLRLDSDGQATFETFAG